MYGLPATFNAACLVGIVLEQICFNQNQVALHFDQKVSIIVESSFSHFTENAEPPAIVDIPVLQSNLMSLVGYTICSACAERNGTLTIKFENGHIFKCYDTSKAYESYTIVLDGKEIIV